MDPDAVGRRDEKDQPAGSPRFAMSKRYQHADQVLGKRWVSLILRALLSGPCRFSEIAAALALSDRTLSARLTDLEAHGIVERRVDAGTRPVRIEYVLTAKGRALEPVIRETDRWAECWMADDGPELAAQR